MFEIRLAIENDFESIWTILTNAISEMDKAGILQWDEIYPTQDIVQEDIDSQTMHVLLKQGAVIGFITANELCDPEYNDVNWKLDGKAIIIHRLVVDPSQQGQGYAKKLMNFVEKEVASKGYDCIRLDAFSENKAANSFYSRRGYSQVGTISFRKGEFLCYERKT